MKYEGCITCKHLGFDCDGPNLLVLEPAELREWLNELRKKRPGMTYDRTATETHVSKTAVYNFLTDSQHDCTLGTARPIAKLYIGGNCGNNPCGNVTSSEKAAYEEKIRQLEAEIAWRNDKIQHLTDSNSSMQLLITNTNKRNADDKTFMQEQIKGKNKTIRNLVIALSICLLVIVGALIIDRLNPEIGFFWLGSLLDGGSGSLPNMFIQKIT